MRFQGKNNDPALHSSQCDMSICFAIGICKTNSVLLSTRSHYGQTSFSTEYRNVPTTTVHQALQSSGGELESISPLIQSHLEHLPGRTQFNSNFNYDRFRLKCNVFECCCCYICEIDLHHVIQYSYINDKG